MCLPIPSKERLPSVGRGCDVRRHQSICFAPEHMLQERTHSSLHVVLRPPRRPPYETDVATVLVEFRCEEGIPPSDLFDIVEHCFGQKWIVPGTQKQSGA